MAKGEMRTSESRRYVFACAVFASLNSVLLGYDVGVMSGCILFIQRDLHITEVQQEVLVGSLSFISLLGSLAGGRTADAIGRKWTIGLAAIVFQAGAAVMTFAPSFLVLMIGRSLAGIGIGFGVMIAPVYIAEISPAVARGSFTSFPEIFINLGILLGYVSNYAFSGLSEHINWRVMLAVGILPSVFIAFALFAIPESPRWLIMQKRVEEAREVLLKISDHEEEAKLRLAEIEEAAGLANAEKYDEKSVWREILRPSPVLGRMLITGLGIQCFQQITGHELVSRGVGIGIAVLAVCGNVAFFSVGMGPICWVVSSEIYPLKVRAKAAALGAVGNRVSSGLVAMSFLSMSHAISVAGTFFIFSVLSALSVIFVYMFVPETKGKSLEEIEMLFGNEREWQGGELELGDVEHLVQKE